MDLTTLIPLMVIALGALFMYFVGMVIVQTLRLSILQVKSDVKIKMDQHQTEIEQQKLYIESKRLKLTGKTETEEAEKGPEKETTTMELSIDGETTGLKEALESIGWVRKFAILKGSVLLDIEKGRSPTELIEEIEQRSKARVTEVSIAKNTGKRAVKKE